MDYKSLKEKPKMKTTPNLHGNPLPTIPPLRSQEDAADPIAYAKFFLHSFTWFACEFDGEDLFYGMVYSCHCPEGEYGYFSLEELEGLPLNLGIVERDKYFSPSPMSEIDNPCLV